MEKAAAANATGSTSGGTAPAAHASTATKSDTGYGKDIKGKRSMITTEAVNLNPAV